LDPGSADASAPLLNLAGIRARIAEIQNPPVQRALLAAIDTANGDLTRAQKNVEAWFDSSMDRVSGWYKRKTQLVLFLIGLGAAVVMNVNSFSIAQFLYKDKPTRDALVAQAQSVVNTPDSVRQKLTFQQIHTSIDTLNLPIGWVKDSTTWYRPAGSTVGPPSLAGIVGTLGGWLLTAFAVSFGAPFWFDLLNKFMVVRSTVKPHEKSPEESSDDRQSKNAAPPPHLGGGAPPPTTTPTTTTGGGGAGGGGGPPPGGPQQPPADPNDPGPDYQPQQWAAGNPEEGQL
jgi:hypothetical protein